MTRRLPLLALSLVLMIGSACDSSTEPDPIRLAVADDTLEAVGDVKQMESTVTGTDELPEWVSLHPEIATITRAGTITAVAPGTATVRASVGGRTAEAEVTVLPLVDVQLESVTSTIDQSGTPEIILELRNAGGRGFYRVDMWKERASAGQDHQIVLRDFNDRPAPVEMDISFSTVHPAMDEVDWVVIYSRTPNSVDYRVTGCIRVDGGTPCPIP